MGEDGRQRTATGPVTELGALHQEVGRLCGLVESQQIIIAEARDEARSTRSELRTELDRLPCRDRGACLVPKPRPPSGESAPSRSPTGTTYERVRSELRGELEEAVEEAECTAERTALRVVQERLADLEKEREERAEKTKKERRESIRWGLELAKYALGIAAGAGVVGAVRCELPKASPARPAIVQPQHRDAASAARR